MAVSYRRGGRRRHRGYPTLACQPPSHDTAQTPLFVPLRWLRKIDGNRIHEMLCVCATNVSRYLKCTLRSLPFVGVNGGKVVIMQSFRKLGVLMFCSSHFCWLPPARRCPCPNEPNHPRTCIIIVFSCIQYVRKSDD